MMGRGSTLKRNEWKKMMSQRVRIRDMYQVRGNPNSKRPFNAMYFSAANSEEHELNKAIGGLTLNKYGVVLDSEKIKTIVNMLAETIRLEVKDVKRRPRWFISEAQERQGMFEHTRDKAGNIRDLIDIDQHNTIEYEKDEERAMRHSNDVRVIMI